MQPVNRRGFYLAIFLLGLAWTVYNRPSAGATTAGQIFAPQVGFLAPAFTLTDLHGQTVSLSDYQGQVVLLNFWASWCPPCRAEMPAIQQVYENYRNQGLIVLSINASYQDVPAKMKTFLGSFAYSFPILLDERGAVNQLYAISSLPTTFFIGRDGKVRDLVIGGPLTIAGLSARIEALLQESP
jgi:cytochrome c biogenesis protein CcmG, thiol:disulfide interchange protein DsbE